MQAAVEKRAPQLVILSEALAGGSELDNATELVRRLPGAPVLLFVQEEAPQVLQQALHVGISDYLCLPLRSEAVSAAVKRNLERSALQRDWLQTKGAPPGEGLGRDELETLARLGRSITGRLDLDHVLTGLVSAAVELSDADEGSLLLLDEESGELYMRAALNFQDEFVQTFRLPAQNTLAGSVLESGEPLLLDTSTPEKIKTSYLVHSLVYVPLKIGDRSLGVLGVDNQRSHRPFNQHDVQVLSTLAEYAAIAIENAQLYANTAAERNKIETILARIRDGVIVLDQQKRLVMANQMARSLFNLKGDSITGQLLGDISNQPQLSDLVDSVENGASNQMETTLEDDSVFDVRVIPIADIGLVITMHDITHLKKLDRVKSDFVSTVSHDLRTPLTSILGFVDLLERAGPINDMQRDFILRVRNSVRVITSLMDDMLLLGRLETGFDGKREAVQMAAVLETVEQSLKGCMAEKDVRLEVEMAKDLPAVQANRALIERLLSNLLDNAVKFSEPGDVVRFVGKSSQGQTGFQVMDGGIGIPAKDLPHIFDKFFRGSNVSDEDAGNGLGLAVVKAIVEEHAGRVWVESDEGKGTVFSVVLLEGEG